MPALVARQALSLVELRFVKSYASPSQLTPRSKTADAALEVADMETPTLRRAVARLVRELKHKQDDINTKGRAQGGPLVTVQPLCT